MKLHEFSSSIAPWGHTRLGQEDLAGGQPHTGPAPHRAAAGCGDAQGALCALAHRKLGNVGLCSCFLPWRTWLLMHGEQTDGQRSPLLLCGQWAEDISLVSHNTKPLHRQFCAVIHKVDSKCWNNAPQLDLRCHTRERHYACFLPWSCF